MATINYDAGEPKYRRKIAYVPQVQTPRYIKYNPDEAIKQDTTAALTSSDCFLSLIATPEAANQEAMGYILQALLSSRQPYQLEIHATQSDVLIGVRCKNTNRAEFERLLRGVLSGVQFKAVEPPTSISRTMQMVSSVGPQNRPDWQPLPTLEFFGAHDPLQSLLEAVQPLADGERFSLVMLLRPANPKRLEKANQSLFVPISSGHLLADAILKLQGNQPHSERFEGAIQKRLEERLSSLMAEVVVRLCLSDSRAGRLQERAQSLTQAIASLYGGDGLGLCLEGWNYRSDGLPRLGAWPEGETGLLMTLPECATLWKLPSERCQLVPGIQFVKRPEVAIPPAVRGVKGILLGLAESRGETIPIHLSFKDAQQGPVMLFGKTGFGKSELLKQFGWASFRRADNAGMYLIDPNGKLAIEMVSQCVPAHRAHHAYLLELGNTEYPPRLPLLNPPKGLDEEQLNKFVEATVSILKLIFAQASLTPRMEDALYALVATLAKMENSTLLDASKLFNSRDYRNKALSRVVDIATREFWSEYDALSETSQREMTQPIFRRLRMLYRSPALRNITCQLSGGDITQTIDDELVFNNLAGSSISSGADFLGELLIARRQLVVIAKLDNPTFKHHPLVLLIDESQRYQGVSLPILMRESRKSSQSNILATQYMDAWGENLIKSVIGNFGSLLTFALDKTEAHKLSASLAPFTPEQLQNLDRYQLLVKMQVDGQTQDAILVKTVMVTPERSNTEQEAFLERIRQQTRTKFCRPKAEVEAEIFERYQPQLSAFADSADGEVEPPSEDIYED